MGGNGESCGWKLVKVWKRHPKVSLGGAHGEGRECTQGNGSQRLAVSTILAASARTVQLDAPAAATDLQTPDVEFVRHYDVLRYRVVISYEPNFPCNSSEF